MTTFNELLGQTIVRLGVSDDVITFTTEGNNNYIMQHHQSCCENVYVESVVGDITDLLNTPILLAEEASHKGPESGDDSDSDSDSYTWTFYKLATIKGYVDIRWHGESNGCYSEEVSFEALTE